MVLWNNLRFHSALFQIKSDLLMNCLYSHKCLTIHPIFDKCCDSIHCTCCTVKSIKVRDLMRTFQFQEAINTVKLYLANEKIDSKVIIEIQSNVVIFCVSSFHFGAPLKCIPTIKKERNDSQLQPFEV